MNDNNEWMIEAARDAIEVVDTLAEAFKPLAEISRTLYSFLGQDCHPQAHIDTLGKFHAETIGDGIGGSIESAARGLGDITERAAEEIKEGLEAIAESISGAGEEVAGAILELAKAVASVGKG